MTDTKMKRFQVEETIPHLRNVIQDKIYATINEFKESEQYKLKKEEFLGSSRHEDIEKDRTDSFENLDYFLKQVNAAIAILTDRNEEEGTEYSFNDILSNAIRSLSEYASTVLKMSYTYRLGNRINSDKSITEKTWIKTIKELYNTIFDEVVEEYKEDHAYWYFNFNTYFNRTDEQELKALVINMDSTDLNTTTKVVLNHFNFENIILRDYNNRVNAENKGYC